MNYQEAIITIKSMQCTISAIRRNDATWEATEKAIEALESMPEYEKLKERDKALAKKMGKCDHIKAYFAKQGIDYEIGGKDESIGCL